MTRARRSPGRRLAALAIAAQLAWPAVAAACPACLYGAYGDRTFNWAFVGLIAMPFVVAGGIGGALLYRYGLLRGRRGPRRRQTPEIDHLAAHEETT